jgi:hypothetical protein
MKKIYKATVEIDLYVYAEDEHEADRLAFDNFQKEDVFASSVTGLQEITDVRSISYEDGQSVPWGDERSRSIATILEDADGVGK